MIVKCVLVTRTEQKQNRKTVLVPPSLCPYLERLKKEAVHSVYDTSDKMEISVFRHLSVKEGRFFREKKSPLNVFFFSQVNRIILQTVENLGLNKITLDQYLDERSLCSFIMR